MRMTEKKIYALTDSQSLLRWAENSSVEKRETQQTNVLSFYFKVAENADVKALEKAFNHVLQINDALRLRIFRKKGKLFQYFEEHTPVSLITREIENGSEAFRKFCDAFYQHRIPWFNSPLYYAEIARFGSGAALVMRFHHACVDGYSISLILRQIEKYYDLYKQAEALPEEKTYSVTKYFEREEAYNASEQHTIDRDFWKYAFNHQRSYRYPAGYRANKGACSREQLEIEPELYAKLLAFCRERKCSTQAAIMAFCALTTYIITGKDNFCFYTLSHGRPIPALRKTVGCMMNTVPVFFDMDKSLPVGEFAEKSYMEYLDYLSHGRFAMGEMVPLTFKESFRNFLNFNHGWFLFGSLEIYNTMQNSHYEAGIISYPNIAHQFYCALMEIGNEKAVIDLRYQIRKFKAEKIRHILAVFHKVLELAAEDPSLSIELLKQKVITEMK